MKILSPFIALLIMLWLHHITPSYARTPTPTPRPKITFSDTLDSLVLIADLNTESTGWVLGNTHEECKEGFGLIETEFQYGDGVNKVTIHCGKLLDTVLREGP